MDRRAGAVELSDSVHGVSGEALRLELMSLDFKLARLALCCTEMRSLRLFVGGESESESEESEPC